MENLRQLFTKKYLKRSVKGVVHEYCSLTCQTLQLKRPQQLHKSKAIFLEYVSAQSQVYLSLFMQFDQDQDGFLWPEEVLEALENVNTDLLKDSHLRYVFRVSIFV